MKKILAFFLAMMLILVAGCNRKTDNDTEETTIGTVTRQKPKNDLTKNNADVLNIGYHSNSSERNPLKVTEMAAVNLLWLSYDSMFVIGAGGQLENSLVETYKVREDGKYEFVLRNGITFHDGTELKSSDIISSINIIKEGGEGQEARNTIYSNVKSAVKSAEATNERTLVMELNGGGISPLYVLTFPVLSSNGSGTGLYKINYSGENEIDFSYYEGSWKKQPGIKNIKAKKYSNEDDMSKAYKENAIDAVFTDHRNVGLYKYTKNTRTMNVRSNEFYYLLPNLASGQMSNLKIRQILSYGIDRESIVSRAFDSNAITSDFPIPSEYYIFDNELLTYSLDVGKCIRKFGEQGYSQVQEGVYTYLVKDGQKFSLKIIGLKEDNLYHRIIAQTLSSQLADIGVATEVALLSSQEYSSAMKSKDYDIAIANTNISSEFDLRYILGTQGSCNYNAISMSAVDTALNNIADIKNDPAKIKEEYVKIQEEMVKQIPLIGLCFVTDTFVYNDRLGNVSGAYSNLNMLKDVHQWSFESGGTSTREQRAD